MKRASPPIALLALLLCFFGESSHAREVEHPLEIVHPGDASATPLPHTLVQILDAEGEPAAYTMWVDSVICRDEVCDVVKVQLHWDALGRYQRYEVALGSQLTKLDHIPFTQRDLARLQEILADPESPLREVEKEAMTGKKPAKKAKNSAAVDGVTGATILTLKNAVIIGAGYTCYDLWHWSNGLLTDHIRDFTGAGSSEKKLLAYLAGDDLASSLLALDYLRKRKVADKATVRAVIARAGSGDKALIVPILHYLENTAPTPQFYYDSILDLFSAIDSKKRLLVLETLSTDPKKPVPGFYDRLCAYLPGLETFFEVQLFLTLMEKRNPGSPTVARKTAELLEHEKFFISRRAYTYLEQQTLPANLRKRVDAYYRKHEDRL